MCPETVLKQLLLRNYNLIWKNIRYMKCNFDRRKKFADSGRKIFVPHRSIFVKLKFLLNSLTCLVICLYCIWMQCNGVRTFHPKNISPQNISPQRHFTLRTFNPSDISPHGHFTPLFKKRIQRVKRNKKIEQLLRNWCVNNRTKSIKGLDLKATLHFLNAY